jgi:hypothetical protein
LWSILLLGLRMTDEEAEKSTAEESEKAL